jgi:capsid protein
MALAGELPGYFDDPEPFHAVEFIPPAIPGVDPQKDAAADAEELRLGLTSRRQLVAKRGYSVEDLDAEIAADRERQKALGLTFGESSNAA